MMALLLFSMAASNQSGVLMMALCYCLPWLPVIKVPMMALLLFSMAASNQSGVLMMALLLSSMASSNQSPNDGLAIVFYGG